MPPPARIISTVRPSVAVIAFFDGDEFVHVAAGDGGDGKPDFLFRGRAGIGFCRNESRA